MANTPNWTGVWSLTNSYNQYDLVSYQGSTWISNTSGNAGNVPGQSNAWSLFAAAGINGFNVWQGAYEPLTVYAAFDAVSYLGSSYVSLVNINQNNPPNISPSQWAPLAMAGAAGPAGAFEFMGVWSSVTQYAPDDIVSYLGSSYVCVNRPPVGDLPTDTTYWMLIASVGAQGATGAQGVQGAIGLGFTWKGAWSSSASYHQNDVVGLLGNSYVAVQANSGVNPSTDNGTNWQIIAAAGTAGQVQPQFQVNGVNLSTPISLINFAEGTNMTITQSGGTITFTASTQAEPVTSVFGRTGAIVAADGDYDFNQLSGSISTSQIPAATITVAQINATGSPSSTTFLRGDGSWATVVASPGTPNGSLQYNFGGVFTGVPGTLCDNAGDITIGSGGGLFTVAAGIHLQSTLEDSTGSVGTSGQLLSSTASGTQWITTGLQGNGSNGAPLATDNHIATGNNATLPGAGNSTSVGTTITLTGPAAYSGTTTYSIQVTRLSNGSTTGLLWAVPISGTQFTVFSTDPNDTSAFFWTCFGKTAND